MRLALLTTGLRPVPLAFHTLPGTPIGIVRWDLPERPSLRRVLVNTPVLADALARARGRDHASLPRLCARHGLRYADIDKRTPSRLAERLRDWRIDLVVTSGCALVPMEALADVPHGGINLHPSPLPRYRGADPLLWQVLEGEPVVGASVHRLAPGSDTGDLLDVATAPRPSRASRAELTDLTERQLGLPLLRRSIEDLDAGRARPRPQPSASPTRYARSVAVDELSTLVPRERLDATTFADVVAFLGTCPPAWREPAR